MSELINNSERRKQILKSLILDLHSGVDAETVKQQIQKLLKNIPYGEVVEVEQELIQNGLPVEEITKLCDIHSQVLQGSIDLTYYKKRDKGHPIDTFELENRAIEKLCNEINTTLDNFDKQGFEQVLNLLKSQFNTLYDVDKHFKRKEYLVFPFLERYGITGPPKVMWSKHDEIRELMKTTIEALNNSKNINDLKSIIPFLLKPTIDQVLDMIVKEESILFPMTTDKLFIQDWYEIYQQSLDYGYCMVAPDTEWKPKEIETAKIEELSNDNSVRLPSGKLSYEELIGILNTAPFDMTFVDKDDKVKYFTEGAERIFARSRAILYRDVRMCHPPSSVHIVDQIVEDFRSGRQDRAPFWINMGGKFIHIEYFAVRNENKEYLGTLEVSQDLTKLRELKGEQRLLSYTNKEK